MGPDYNRFALPCPWFSWDINYVPWVDFKGDQFEYSKPVRIWCAFHKNLPDISTNHIVVTNRGIVLLSHLYGRIKYLCEVIDTKVVSSDDGIDIIIIHLQAWSALHYLARIRITTVTFRYASTLPWVLPKLWRPLCSSSCQVKWTGTLIFSVSVYVRTLHVGQIIRWQFSPHLHSLYSRYPSRGSHFALISRGIC